MKVGNRISNKRGSRMWLVWITAAVILAGILLIFFFQGEIKANLFPTQTPSYTNTPNKTSTPTLTFTSTQTFTPSLTNTPLFSPTPTLGIGSTLMRETDGMMMVYVPAGEFTMGMDAEEAIEMFCVPSPELPCLRDNYALGDPAHTVYLDGYWIDQTEVTIVMFKQCVKAGACDAPPPFYRLPSGVETYYDFDPKYGKHPMGSATWYAAQAYCNWVGGRLPSEAQWEKAARGTDGRIYPWGNEEPTCSLSNSGGRCVGLTAPVGSYPEGASPYGALDMAGNIPEWVDGWLDLYPGGYHDGTGYYAESLGTTHRMIRGGGYPHTPEAITTFRRGAAPPDDARWGFRCVVMP